MHLSATSQLALLFATRLYITLIAQNDYICDSPLTSPPDKVRLIRRRALSSTRHLSLVHSQAFRAVFACKALRQNSHLGKLNKLLSQLLQRGLLAWSAKLTTFVQLFKLSTLSLVIQCLQAFSHCMSSNQVAASSELSCNRNLASLFST